MKTAAPIWGRFPKPPPAGRYGGSPGLKRRASVAPAATNRTRKLPGRADGRQREVRVLVIRVVIMLVVLGIAMHTASYGLWALRRGNRRGWGAFALAAAAVLAPPVVWLTAA